MSDEASKVFAGSIPLDFEQSKIKGDLVKLHGETYYKISNYDQMRPFFMSLTSDADIWMFVSSNGGISGGRKNSDHAIFPYYTDDKLSDLHQNTGSKSAFIVELGGKRQLWLPFSDTYNGIYKTSRNLYKNSYSSKLIFEETNHDLGLTFRYSWLNSRQYGIIKKSELINLSEESKNIKLLDGLENILPFGIAENVQLTKSNLANAYKKSELHDESGIGIFSLSSNIIDRPEPSEALLATTVCFTGLNDVTHLLSRRQVSKFLQGEEVTEEKEIRAEPGAYLIVSKLRLGAGETKEWFFALDTAKSAADIVALANLFQKENKAEKVLEDEIKQNTERLKYLIAQADGFQLSGDTIGNARHVSNTLFNIMRGGIFAEAYQIEREDFIEFVEKRNRDVFNEHISYLKSFPGTFSVNEIHERLQEYGSDALLRYSYEYLPITFSRRHGDPSRPWNKFNIDVLRKDGSWEKRFEGNWRDIFQNWEALAYAYPEFAENMITLFLDASTVDGYNPYRITNNGIEWEITDPEDPWSFIGYWGDHQIVYLLKLLELSNAFHPGRLREFVNRPFFTFGNVPYRINDYAEIVKNPYETIIHNAEAEQVIANRCDRIGIDGKLLWNVDNTISKASLTEKLLIPLLTKLSNFVPEGGIWMNTQRPEWNDANNALVGHGLSMVTVFYIYKYISFLKNFYADVSDQDIEVNIEVSAFFTSLSNILRENQSLLNNSIPDESRKHVTDLLGNSGESYRKKVYNRIAEKKSVITKSDLLQCLEFCTLYMEHTIRVNKRPDRLYHTYNLIEIKQGEFGVKHLYPMLEGQVAVLSSGFVKAEEAIEILNALRQSELYRKDQNSYILYPDRKLARFMDKARIDETLIKKSSLVKKLIAVKDTSILIKDENGKYHFHPELCNAKELVVSLERLKGKGFDELIVNEKQIMLDMYESVFNHHSFTGRSGTFFGYEGLGSIYWHMNSKLLLAVQEILERAKENNEEQSILDELKKQYDEIKEGLGTHKSPDSYGAFPIDPYSHTPAHKGAQQPGMTGQVKEDLLSRVGELGLKVSGGSLQFPESMNNSNELLTADSTFQYYTVNGKKEELELEANSMAFTFCQTPIIYKLNEQPTMTIYLSDEPEVKLTGNRLPTSYSSELFQRTGRIKYIKVGLVKEK